MNDHIVVDATPLTPQERSKKNLRPAWQPGQSGNPKGRPVRRPISVAYERMLDEKLPAELLGPLKLKPGATWLDALVQQHFRTALKMTEVAVSARRELADRVEGKAPVRVQFESSETVDINVTFEASPFSNKNDRPIDVEVTAELPAEAVDAEPEKE